MQNLYIVKNAIVTKNNSPKPKNENLKSVNGTTTAPNTKRYLIIPLTVIIGFI